MHQKIKKARMESNISQLEMSELLSISRQSYIDIENGSRIPRSDLLFNISLISNKNIDFFYNKLDSIKLDQLTLLFQGKTEIEKDHYIELLELLIEENKNNHLS
ncbi:helix-turn-helix transcriptional regulator [Photobacterium toruni]|uniref:helix-turn-helix transcriptional regulator n=1 Tax=Photobacterium toruni TaxID=1935446 RepID=UPI002E17B598|nr:helix-turn-helix transcriptional regulator [Photobacterium toruni]